MGLVFVIWKRKDRFWNLIWRRTLLELSSQLEGCPIRASARLKITVFRNGSSGWGFFWGKVSGLRLFHFALG